MTEEQRERPRVFISYSWTSSEHIENVVDLAERLSSDGVRVILDRWDLQEGQDKYSFMEQMVHDDSIGRVLIICDEGYEKKANEREGGVGTESQIISQEVYEEEAQEKFVPVVFENDESGDPHKPTYLESRIHIDLSEPQSFEDEYEKLVRNIFDKPRHEKPTIGQPPSYITEEEPIQLRTSSKYRAFKGALERDASTKRGRLRDYLDALSGALADQTLTADEDSQDENVDELVYNRIERWRPYRDEYVDFLQYTGRYSPYQGLEDDVYSFLERALSHVQRPDGGGRWNRLWADATKFLLREIFSLTVTVWLEHEKTEWIAELLDRTYFVRESSHRPGGKHVYFDRFDSYIRSLDEVRKQRLELNRSSITADLIKQRADKSGPDFGRLIDTDIILFARSLLDLAACDDEVHGNIWYPRTIVYRSRGGSFEIADRLKSRRYFEDFKQVLGVGDKEELEARIAGLPSERAIVKEGFLRISARDIGSILEVDDIGTVP